MNKRTGWLVVVLAAGLGLTLALLGFTQSAQADLWAGEMDVGRASATQASTCQAQIDGEPTIYDTVQDAVDAASTADLIKVSGYCTGTTSRFGLDQVVHLTKTLTIQGGYPPGFVGPPDPETYPSTLDAQGTGRVFYIAGLISPTIQGLQITGGDAAGQGGLPWGSDSGGGIYVFTSTTTISNCVIYSNTASSTGNGSGGGVLLRGSPSILSGNRIMGNTASPTSYGEGGGLFLWQSDAELSNNTVQDNIAGEGGEGRGGGMYIGHGNPTLSGNRIINNTASTTGVAQGGGLRIDLEGNDDSLIMTGNSVMGNISSTGAEGDGGGIYIGAGPATLSGNTVQGNIGSTTSDGKGGGLYLTWPETVTLGSNSIISNTAAQNPGSDGQGGGLWVTSGSSITLTNNLVAYNHATDQGSGMWFSSESVGPRLTPNRLLQGPMRPTFGRLLHNTIADNRGSGQGVFVGDATTLAFTNTIIVGHHGVGITTTTESTVTLEATLWYYNEIDTIGGDTVTSTTNVYGNPAFFNPAAWNYHITPSSAAIDQGVDTDVVDDIDGHPRTIGSKPDLGADEAWPPVHLPLVLRNYG
jgi:hypothetical protein